MPIEIKELVIRATVEKSKSGGQNDTGGGLGSGKKSSGSENMDMIIQLIKDKKER